MKRYHLMAGHIETGYFGWDGFRGSFSEVDEAIVEKDKGDLKNKRPWSWWQVVDSFTGLYVAHHNAKDAEQLAAVNEPLTARVAA